VFLGEETLKKKHEKNTFNKKGQFLILARCFVIGYRVRKKFKFLEYEGFSHAEKKKKRVLRLGILWVKPKERREPKRPHQKLDRGKLKRLEVND
jgi:hypothetical protein